MIGNKFNEFQSVTVKVIKTFLKFDVQNKPMTVVEKPVKLFDFSAIINIIGKFRGLIIVTIENSTEEKLVKRFCEVNKITFEKAKEKNINVIGEIINMIVGNFFSVFNKEDKNIDLTSPNFIKGKNMTYFSNPAKAKQLSFSTPAGDINIVIELAGYKSILST